MMTIEKVNAVREKFEGEAAAIGSSNRQIQTGL